MSYKTYKKSFAFLAIAVLIFIGAYFVLGGYGTSGPSSAPNLEEQGLVGYWNMEEGTGQTVYDRSGNGNNGTLGASTAVAKDDPVFTSGYSSAGAGGTALKFDGVNDYVNAGNGASLNITSAITIEAWVKRDVIGTLQNIVEKSGSYGIRLGGNYTYWIEFYYHDGTSWYGIYSDASTILPVVGTWYHIVAVRDSSRYVSLYLNGVVVKAPTLTNQARSVTNSVMLGSYQGGSQYFPGSIDEVRIYNRALSADEIRQHYNQKKPILEMKFDEGSGTSTKDESFNNNDGTLNLGTGGNTTVANAWVQGKYSSAISFDGTDDQVSGSLAGTPVTTRFSINYWIKPGSLGTQQNHAFLGVGGGARVVPYMNSSNIFRCWTTAGDLSSGVTLATGTWYNLGCTYDGTTLKAYVNGVQKASSDISLTLTANNFTIGADNGGTWTNGQFDEVRIYNYARTQDEILTDYNAGKAAHLGKDNQRDDGLVGYWNMEEGTGQTVYDRSGNSNSGTLGASTSVGKDDPVFASGYSSSGPGGTALQFDGVNDYVNAGNGASLNNLNYLTVEAWFKVVVGSKADLIVAKHNGGQDGSFYMGIEDTTGKMRFMLINSASTRVDLDTTQNYNDGNWYHAAATYDGAQMKIYINGSLVVSTPQSGSIKNYASTVKLGTYDGSGWFLNGSIDEVRIYNRALSADEIRQHYNQKKPVLEMKFDEGTGTSTKDESFNNNDGTLNLGTGGNTTVANAWVQGKYSSAISFDGTDDYVSAADSASLDSVFGTEVFTLEAWLYFNGVNGNYQGIINKRTSAYYSASPGGLFMELNSNTLRFLIGTGNEAETYDNIDTTLPNTTWTHIVGTADGSNMRLYKNGILVGTITITKNPPTNNEPLTIGAFYDYVRSFNGLIDEPRIYNYARTQDEILTDYNAGKAAHLGKDNQRDDGMVGYWNMEEGTGQTVYDRSGNGNNGTLGASTAVAKDDPVFDSGAPSPSTGSGSSGSALRFDGVNDYVNAGSGASLNVSSAVTIEAWVKLPSGYSSSHKMIVSKSAPGWYLSIYNNKVFLSVWINGVQQDPEGTKTVSGDMWHHVVGTYDIATTKYRTYLDGIIDLDTTRSGTSINTNSNPLYFSAYSTPGDYPFNGSIDEVRIYNRALSADEIRQHYNQKKPILEMKFDEGSGTSTKDESFNNNDGTLNLGTGGNTTVANAWVQGKYGSAITFDGVDDYVSVNAGSGSILDIVTDQSFTFEMWTKVTSINTSAITNLFIRPGWHTGFRIETDGKMYFYVWSTASGFTAADTSPVSLNQWIHWVGVFDYQNNKIYLYRDGLLVGQANFSGTPRNLSDDYYIGGYTGQNYFNGLIDDVRIYNYARTAEEVKVDYNAGLATHFR